MSFVSSPQEKFFIAFQLLIDTCLEQQEKLQKNIPYDSRFNKEFATVKIACSRQSGHSSAILRYCQNNADYQYLVLTPNSRMSQGLKDAAKENSIHNCIIRSFSETGSFIGIGGIKGVFVDCSFFLSKTKEEEIYKILTPALSRDNYKNGIYQYFFAFVQ